MASPSVSYTFSNNTTAVASEVNTNFTDLVNAMTDGTKDFSISALTVGGVAAFNGSVTLGNGSPDDITFTGSLASSIGIKTNTTYDFGSSTLGLRYLYFGGSSTYTGRLAAPTLSASANYTLPSSTGTLKLTTESLTATKTSTYTALTSDDVIVCDTSGGAFTVDLYGASGNSGKVLTIIQIGSGTNAVTVDGSSSETINGDTTWTVTGQYSYIKILCNGSNWIIIDSKFYDRRSVVLSANTSTSTANTWVDITGASLTLPKGIWNMNYDGSAYMIRISGSGAIVGNVAITDSSNNLIQNSMCLYGGYVDTASFLNVPLNLSITNLNVSTSTTYKARLRASVDLSTTGLCTIYYDGFAGVLTDPDVQQKFYAVRVG